MISSVLLTWAMAAYVRILHYPLLARGERMGPEPAPPLQRCGGCRPTATRGLAELLSCIDLSDTLTLIAATAVCKAMSANHVTDLVGRERFFAQELSRLVNGNYVKGTVAMPPTKRDMLLEALTAVSARHVSVVWTKSDQDEAVESLKALALAERMFRQSESTPRTLEGHN